MKYYLFPLLAASVMVQSVSGQSVSNTYATDINGHSTATSTVLSSRDKTNSEKTEISRSVNGRQVPLERSEERILRDDSSGKVVEKTIRKYDPNGQITSTERVLTEEQKLSSGGAHISSTVYRTDLNGSMQQAERTTTDIQKQSGGSREDTVVERPSVNGSFEPSEKRTVITQDSSSGAHQDETVYRRSGNGGFDVALRQVKDQEKAGNRTVEKTAFYEPGVTGTLQLTRQTVSTDVKNPDGSEVVESDLYGRSVDGRSQESGAAPQLKEQQIVRREKGPGDSVVETLSVRRPSVSDPKRLGALQKISETICTGKCLPEEKR